MGRLLGWRLIMSVFGTRCRVTLLAGKEQVRPLRDVKAG